MQTDEICQAIVAVHKRRRFVLKQQQKMDRSLESYVRLNHTGWAAAGDTSAREKANRQVAALIRAARDGSGNTDLASLVAASDAARLPWDAERATCERQMKKLVRQLPAWASFVKGVPGVGELGLAIIVGEAGNLSNYAEKGKLFKRLGCAPHDGHAGSTWRCGAAGSAGRALSKPEWVAFGYNAERYSQMTVLAGFLFVKQWCGASKSDDGLGRPDGPYGEAYAVRRAHAARVHPDWTPGHLHKDAVRVMWKRFLADLLREWKAVERTILFVPAAPVIVRLSAPQPPRLSAPAPGPA